MEFEVISKLSSRVFSVGWGDILTKIISPLSPQFAIRSLLDNFKQVICIYLVSRKISTLSVAKLLYLLIGKRKAIILTPWFSIQQRSGGVISPEKDFQAYNGFEKELLVSRYHLGRNPG